MRLRPSGDQRLACNCRGRAPNHRIFLLHARSCDVPPSLLRGSGVDCAATRPDVVVRRSRMTAGWRYVVAGVGLAMGVVVAVGTVADRHPGPRLPAAPADGGPDRHRHRAAAPVLWVLSIGVSHYASRRPQPAVRRRRRPRHRRRPAAGRPPRPLPRGPHPGADRRRGDPREHALRALDVSSARPGPTTSRCCSSPATACATWPAAATTSSPTRPPPTTCSPTGCGCRTSTSRCGCSAATSAPSSSCSTPATPARSASRRPPPCRRTRWRAR